jgi:hypothetical protein
VETRKRARRRDPRAGTSAIISGARDTGRRRAGALVLAAGLVLVIAAAGVVALGLLTGPARAGRPAAGGGALASAASARPAAGPQGPAFGTVAGYGCRSTPQASFSEHGRYVDGSRGFVTVQAGGWAHQGCGGRFDAMPMSGSATRPDPANYALWTFHTGAVAAGTCQTAVFVPRDTSVEHVGGHPARYKVFAAATASGPVAGAFTVDELSSRGQWVSGGSYSVTKGVLTVELTSAGQDWHGNVLTHAHLAVSQVLLFCTR